MRCTSFVPVNYLPRGLNGAAGFSWHLMNGNATYGDQIYFNNSSPLSTLDPYLSYDKDVLRQIVQNHEATFRYQVQELHRLYQRQRELMEDMRMRGMAAHRLILQTSETVHCMSYPYSDISQTSSAPTWLLGDHKLPKLTEKNQQCPSFAVENFPEQTTISSPGTLMRQNGCNAIKFLPSICEGKGKRILNLELPADEEGKQFKAPEVTCDASKKHSDCQPTSGSETGSAITGYICSYRKTDCLIDLNEPIQLESVSFNSFGSFETCTRYSDPCVSGETTPESLVPKRSILLNCDGGSNGINLPMAIDLNSVPENCFPETGTTENIPIVNEGITAVQDSLSADDFATRREKCDGDAMFTDTRLKILACIDLNSSTVAAEHSPLPCTTKDEIGSPKGNSAHIQLETSLLSERGDEKSPLGRDIIAAETLVEISSRNSLCWFVEVASSIGDDLENEITGLQNNETDSDLGELQPCGIYDFRPTTMRLSTENAVNFCSWVRKYRVIGALSSRLTKSTRRRASQDNEFPRRNVRKKVCVQTIKCSKLAPSDVLRKSMSSILKQPATRSKQGVLPSWGSIRKREGGERRRASKFIYQLR